MTDTALQDGNAGTGARKVPYALIGWWMTIVAALVFIMVIVGGVTRLTESGLSIVEWKPVSGALPPLSVDAWQAEFDNYKQFPEYQKINKGMSLDEFKFIFWWEWSHRLLGRFIGAMLLIPFLILWFSKRLDGQWARRTFGLGCLVGVQGAIGWWMVASGLVDHPDVSQYRLATHLLVATVIFMYAVRWAFECFDLAAARPFVGNVSAGMRWFVGLVLVQFFLGAMVAGIDAGFAFPTWPDMDGRFIPEDFWDPELGLLNFFENIATVQFDHRMVAYAITLFAVILFIRLRKGGAVVQFWLYMLVLAVLGQVVLGILTILQGMQLEIAASHQGGALVVLAVALRLQYVLNRQ